MNARETPFWAHQQAAFDFVCKLWGRGQNGAMLALAMGLGKSRVAVELAGALKANKILIVSPLRVVSVWEAQFEKYAVFETDFLALDDRVKSVREKLRQASAALERLDILDRAATVEGRPSRLARPLVVSINYDSARIEPFASYALNRVWDLIILDESHRIKEPGGRTSRWASRMGLRAKKRLALTGTPMPHEPTDIWAQFRFLDPNLLDSAFSAFRWHYAVMGGYMNREVVAWRNLDRLEADFRKIAFRVDESALDLPEEMDETRSCSLGPEGARLYRQMEQEMIAWIEAGHEVTAANAMVKLLRLQQITGGSLPDDQGQTRQIDSAKEALLEDLLEDLKEPAVVFARFRADLDAIHRAAQRAGLASLELSGRRDELAIWQGGKGAPVGLGTKVDGRGASEVLAVQIQAGGVGVDLTRARIAIYYSFGFSLVDYKQSRSRIRRPPQTRPCVFYHLQVRNSVDEYVLRAVLARQNLIDSTLNELKAKGDRHAQPAA